MSARFTLKPLVLASVLAFSPAVFAQATLPSVLGELMQISPRVAAAKGDEAAAQARVKETFRRAWTPSVELSAESGEQRFKNGNVDAHNVDAKRGGVKATQLLYDFGRSNALVTEAEAVAQQTAVTAQATTEGLLLDALTAHWSVVRARKVLAYAQQSEASVLNQTKLEGSMVELGKGYESNVLQAKVQLATAEARRIRAEGALEIAEARVRAVYGDLTKQVPYGQVAVPLQDAMPKSLEEAKSLAVQNNRQIQIGHHRSEAIRERGDGIRAKEFLPRLQAVAEDAFRNSVDGNMNQVHDKKWMVQLQYNFGAGLVGLPALEAVRKDWFASKERERDTRELVLEQVNIAWRNLLVARTNRTILQNQVNIATKFLEMATAERQLGRRSLLDVLSAEMSLINAQSDLAATEADEAIAGLTLMQSIGRLTLDTVQFKVSTIVAGLSPEAVTPANKSVATSEESALVQLDVVASLQEWAKAWRSQNLNAYLAHYADDFDTGRKSRVKWEKEREARILGKKSIVVSLNDIQVNVVSPDQAEATFVQDYQAGPLVSREQRFVKMRRHGGAWQIVHESGRA